MTLSEGDSIPICRSKACATVRGRARWVVLVAMLASTVASTATAEPDWSCVDDAYVSCVDGCQRDASIRCAASADVGCLAKCNVDLGIVFSDACAASCKLSCTLDGSFSCDGACRTEGALSCHWGCASVHTDPSACANCESSCRETAREGCTEACAPTEGADCETRCVASCTARRSFDRATSCAASCEHAVALECYENATGNCHADCESQAVERCTSGNAQLDDASDRTRARIADDLALDLDADGIADASIEVEPPADPTTGHGGWLAIDTNGDGVADLSFPLKLHRARGFTALDTAVDVPDGGGGHLSLVASGGGRDGWVHLDTNGDGLFDTSVAVSAIGLDAPKAESASCSTAPAPSRPAGTCIVGLAAVAALVLRRRRRS